MKLKGKTEKDSGEKYDIKFLTRVFSTVVHAIIRFIEKYHDEFFFIGGTESVKDRMYKNIVKQNFSKISGYSIMVSSFNSIPGILIIEMT